MRGGKHPHTSEIYKLNIFFFVIVKGRKKKPMQEHGEKNNECNILQRNVSDAFIFWAGLKDNR